MDLDLGATATRALGSLSLPFFDGGNEIRTRATVCSCFPTKIATRNWDSGRSLLLSNRNGNKELGFR